jgi:hypothetical protein
MSIWRHREIFANFSSFGQEQTPIPAIQAVTSGGGPGVAATLAGSAVSTILAATNPCLKVRHPLAACHYLLTLNYSSSKPMKSSLSLVQEPMPSRPLKA